MASKYAFSTGLKELRFLFCQTSEHSAATRYDAPTARTKIAMRRRRWKRRRIAGSVANWAYRNFLQRSYPTMKKHNPHTPILIREASGFEPTLFARYSASKSTSSTVNGTDKCVDYGKEKKIQLKGLDDKSIEQKVTELVQSESA